MHTDTQVFAQGERERERGAYYVENCDAMKLCTSSYCGQVPCIYYTEADV